MYKKITATIFSILLGAFVSAQVYAETKTTTTEETTVQTKTVPQKTSTTQTTSTVQTSPPRHSTVKPKPATTTTTYNNTSETTITNFEPRKVMDEEALKKIQATLCTPGFKAYISTDVRNVCQSTVKVPDIAYSCVWKKKGPAAFAETDQGPCSLDFTKHNGSVAVSKATYPHNAPLAYGTEAQCCLREAKDPASAMK